jgi:hypothetical protein
MAGTFFDEDEGLSLEYMPLTMRYRLDRAGVKLSLKAWQALPYETRRALCEHPVDTEALRETLRTRCVAIGEQTGVPATFIQPAEDPPPWRTHGACDRVLTRAEATGTSFARAQWEALSDEHAYILWRLADPAKDGARFVAALRALCPS